MGLKPNLNRGSRQQRIDSSLVRHQVSMLRISPSKGVGEFGGRYMEGGEELEFAIRTKLSSGKECLR